MKNKSKNADTATAKTTVEEKILNNIVSFMYDETYKSAMFFIKSFCTWRDKVEEKNRYSFATDISALLSDKTALNRYIDTTLENCCNEGNMQAYLELLLSCFTIEQLCYKNPQDEGGIAVKNWVDEMIEDLYNRYISAELYENNENGLEKLCSMSFWINAQREFQSES